ncbi:response regulator transcription factor [Streptomyces canus]|uniref:response regulator transcription factor n=1 Tax=Streptomyces canus TaxID=58343 RepID=UPI002E2CA1E5|nr:response regulator transcription factor [Streptomyces canus]
MEDRIRGISVLLVSHLTLLLEGLQKIISIEDGMDVFNAVETAEEACEVASSKNPDIVVLYNSQGGSEISHTVERMRETLPSSRIIVISAETAPLMILDMVRLGISAYLPQQTSPDELTSTIRSVMGDGSRVTLSLPREALQRFPETDAPSLTSQEVQILVMVAMAMTNGQIASHLSLTEATVKRHLRNIFRRLGAVSRIDAVNKARRANLLFPAHAAAARRLASPIG